MRIMLIVSLLAPLFGAGLAAPAWAQNPGVPGQGGDPAKQCASYGLAPGSDGYKACVSAMADADAADTGADMTQMQGDMDRQRAQLRAQIQQQNADMQKQIQDQMNAAQHPADGSPSKCVTTVNGTNTSTVCP